MKIENISVEDLIEHSAKELMILQEKLAEAIDRRKKSEKSELIKTIRNLAKESGFTVEELMSLKSGDEAKVKSRSEVAIKYRNPANPEETWTGRGLAPKWLKELTGGDKEKFKDYLV